MKHNHSNHAHHCHCGLHDQLKKLRAGKLGLLGCILIVGHLLFHVAECLLLPAILVAFHGHDAEAVEELEPQGLKETTISDNFAKIKYNGIPLKEELSFVFEY